MTTMQSDASTLVDDEFATEILPRRRRRLPAVTAVLAVCVFVGAGFIGGVEVQKHYGGSSSSSGANAASAFARLRSSFTGVSGAGGAGFGNPGLFGGGGGGQTAGTVTLIKGSTLYVTSSNGNTVMVHTGAGSQVTKTVSGTLQTVHPGDTVAVTGTTANDGSVTARTIAVTSGGTSNGQ